MEDYSINTGTQFHDYHAYWLSYTHLSDRILLVDTTLIGINNRKFTLLSMFFMKVDHHTEKFAHFWPILKPILDGPKMIP